jgi:hypothetical protein
MHWPNFDVSRSPFLSDSRQWLSASFIAKCWLSSRPFIQNLKKREEFVLGLDSNQLKSMPACFYNCLLVHFCASREHIKNLRHT